MPAVNDPMASAMGRNRAREEGIGLIVLSMPSIRISGETDRPVAGPFTTGSPSEFFA